MKISSKSLTKTFSILAISLVAYFNNAISAQENSAGDGFASIFDGETLSGWEGDPVYWRVENGSIVGEVTPETILDRNTFIIWQEGSPANFELKLEYRISPTGNSGVNYRSGEIEEVPFALRGYQCDIDGRNRYTGQNYEERARTTLAYPGEIVELNKLEDSLSNKPLQDLVARNAWSQRTVIDTLGDLEEMKSHIKSEDWNEIHLIVNGNRLLHYVNGILMSDVTDNDANNRKMRGLIGVQVHVGPPMKVEYKNIRLKILN